MTCDNNLIVPQTLDKETIKILNQDILVSDIENILALPLTYQQLCDKLHLNYTKGNSKRAQISQLQQYCDLTIKSNPTRYIINDIYDKAERQIAQKIHGNNKFQSLFDIALCDALINNEGQELFLSNTEALKLFNEVNSNFTKLYSDESLDKYPSYFPYMGKIVYRILWRWTMRRLKAMENRGLVIVSKGMRLYSKIHIDSNSEIIKITNAPSNSDLEKWCLSLYNHAVNEVMPPNWTGDWVPEDTWKQFERRLDEIVSKESAQRYFKMRKVILLRPAAISALEAEKEVVRRSLDSINHEATHKIMSTSQLDGYSMANRQKFIDVNIKSTHSK